jgi:hypothetical protein
MNGGGGRSGENSMMVPRFSHAEIEQKANKAPNRHMFEMVTELPQCSFPGHKIVERLPGSIDGEFDDCCVIDKAQERRLVGN